MVGIKRSLAAAGIVSGAWAHPHHSKRALPVGAIISDCVVPNSVAMTFDDGPAAYTDQLLNTLKSRGHKATFFVNGDNYSKIGDYASTVKRMVAEGHQIGSHT